MEGISPSDSVRDVELALEFEVGGKVIDDKIRITVGQIQIYVEGIWQDVPGSITVLKGTKYSFKPVPYPCGTLPSGEPQWSGIVNGTGETIDVSFTDSGTYTLTARFGPSYDSEKNRYNKCDCAGA